jgi:hypothetical protein
VTVFSPLLLTADPLPPLLPREMLSDGTGVSAEMAIQIIIKVPLLSS